MGPLMSKTKKIVLASAAFVIIALLVVAGLTGNGNLAGTAWSLFPPVVAIALALITKEGQMAEELFMK